ncbi:MAG TPA: hypothetical protein VLI44_04920, partial [Sporolactobacillaceae bacterium]|nr:hypothetical protein [Sporolactobacillaceae bacterium]
WHRSGPNLPRLSRLINRAEGLLIERKTDAMSEDGRLLMCPENLHEGMRLGPIHYIVMPEQARAFANAVGAQDPEFIPDA